MSAELEAERVRLREVLGRYGIWRGRPGVPIDYAVEAERLGFGSLWAGGSPAADLVVIEEILAATDRIVVATGIVNIWSADVGQLAESFQRVDERHPGRFILGIGTGHPERIEQAAKPYGPLVEYLDALESRGVPAHRLALAALGPRVTALAGERTLGAHPYFAPSAHTAAAREVLGTSPLLIPEARVTLEPDGARARDLLRPGMEFYFALTNYRNNLLRLGYTEEELDPARDEAIDALAVWGGPDRVKAGLDAYLSAGADHVLAQIVAPDGADLVAELRRLAAALGLTA
ncbi:MAG TPA: TIGR03620 family F420-dependent LLM class oxidoreductase [Microbacteriaceae bacterium]|nr:TIGR03620 family F420-dependent LLM class oxidoreductase [Microbacteriaceae bacterium]